MQRYFVDKIDNIITGSDFHHIKNVMRMNAGDFIVVCANNTCYQAKINKITEIVEYEIVNEIPKSNNLDITLIQGLPKNNKVDIIIKYATCLGVSKIIFSNMIRSIAKVSNVDNKQKRFSTIAKEAAELAHRLFVPEISFSMSLKSIELNDYDYVILADEEEKEVRIKDLDIELTNKRIAIIIGPEGGIDQKEREYLKNKAISISLGDNILPTEVASLYLLASLNEIK